MRASSTVVVGLLWLPSPAGAATGLTVSVFSDQRDFIGRGAQHIFDRGNADVGVIYEGGVIKVWAISRSSPSFSLEFGAPPGERLEPRNYVGVQRLPFRDRGHAGMEIVSGSRGCNRILGRFEVRELAVAADGSLDRLWIVYQQHCEGLPPATFGEVRLGPRLPAVGPRIVRWPPHDRWRAPTVVPVRYRGGSALASAAVVGSGARDFALDASRCLGRPGPCDVLVRLRAAGAGMREATARLVDTAGHAHDVSLEAFIHGGVTKADLEVLPGDVASPEPGRYQYTPSNAEFGGAIWPGVAELTVHGIDGRFWDAQFWQGGGADVTPGSYPNASAFPSGTGPAASVTGDPAYCNQTGSAFTIYSLSRMPDGTLRTLDAAFEQRCYSDRRPALRGVWRFRAGSLEPLAAWLVPGSRPGVDAPAELPAACPNRMSRRARLMRGTRGADRLRGSGAADVLVAGRGADRIRALGGADCVIAGRGGDRVYGGTGRDALLGGPGNDVLVGGPGRDVLLCGPGTRDRAVASRGDRTRGCEHVRRA